MAFRDLRRQIVEDFEEVRQLAGFDDHLRIERWCAEQRAIEVERRREIDEELRRLRPKRPRVTSNAALRKAIGALPRMDASSIRRRWAPGPSSPRAVRCRSCGRRMPNAIAAGYCCPDGAQPANRAGDNRGLFWGRLREPGHRRAR